MEHEQSTEQIEKQGSFGEPTIPKPVETPPEPPKRRKPKPLRIVITTIALGVSFGVFGIVIYYQFYNQRNPASYTPPPAVSQISEYPDTYKQAKLPEYPNAEITSSGQKTATLNDGINVIVRTYDDIPTVASFYDKALVANDWKPDDSITSDTAGKVYYKTYIKGDAKYTITATSSNQVSGTDISISYVKR